MRVARRTVLVLAAFLVSIPIAAQQPQQSDPQAIALAGRALLGLTGGTPVYDVVLTGAATRIAGSDHETGTVTFKARSTRDSRVGLNLASGQRVEILSALAGPSGGSWSGPNGVFQPVALHNTFTDAAWFFPPLSSLASASSPDVIVSYVGQETWGGIAVQHLRFSRQARTKSQLAATLVHRLYLMDFYLASDSLLPLAVRFNTHPDTDASTDIPTEVTFSDYRLVGGVRVPFQIQKFINGGLILDVSISNAAINVGLQDADFSAR